MPMDGTPGDETRTGRSRTGSVAAIAIALMFVAAAAPADGRVTGRAGAGAEARTSVLTDRRVPHRGTTWSTYPAPVPTTVTIPTPTTQVPTVPTTLPVPTTQVPTTLPVPTTATTTPTTPAPTTTTAPGGVGGDGRFHVVGTGIVGPDGLPFVPRGVNKGGLEWRSDGYDIAWWNFLRMKGWGANFVRVPLSPHFWLPSMCTYDPAYVARVDQIVAWAEALQMLVLLDDHWSTQDRTCGSSGWADQQKMADSRNVEFLRSMATRYKDHPWVAFDLYNEPHDISDAVWRDGGVVDGWQAVGMQQLLDTVRATGASNLVFASGNVWANDLRMVVDHPLRSDTDVVYAAHSYPIWCDSGPIPDTVPYSCHGSTLPPFLETWIAPAIAKRAVVVTEFGTRRAIADEVSAPIAWFEAHHIGWSAYLWGSGPSSEYCLLSPAGDLSPSILGVPVQQALWASQGWHSLFGR